MKRRSANRQRSTARPQLHAKARVLPAQDPLTQVMLGAWDDVKAAFAKLASLFN